jgi:hypothetical protein
MKTSEKKTAYPPGRWGSSNRGMGCPFSTFDQRKKTTGDFLI